MNRPKIIFYGAAKSEKIHDIFEINDEQVQKIKDIIENVFEACGYEIELDINIEENSMVVGSKEKREQRLIDSNNIDWRGFHLTAAFAEFMEHVLNKQKEVTLNDKKPRGNSTQDRGSYESYNFFSEEDYDPCHGCASFGSSGCRNDCPYGD